ncbi:PREDICTED: myb-binding protein 1A-like, partial [Rhagoletis zephyria]|uniref:myb-binding protein 1A-like n=1 Tax=Rhagoletis zephyria TaxID=28612 RepID=UPI00081120C3
MVKTKTNKGNAPCNQVILDHFWNISDPSDEKRCRSTQVILQTLASQINNPNNASNDVGYCIDRLTRGLLSSRDFARHGFCVLLTSILEQFPEQSNIAEVFEQAQKEYGLKVAENTAETTISWTLFLGCILKSGRVTLDIGGDLITQISDYLFRLGSKKNYVEIVVCNLLPLYLEIFAEKPKVFKKTVLPMWEAHEDKKSLFYAYFIMLARKHLSLRECFTKFFNSNVYQLGSNDYGQVLSLLKETTAYHPNIHPINELLVTTLFEIEPENVASLCSAIVEDVFKVNWAKSSLGFEMTHIMLKLATPEQVELVLSPKFMRLFIQTLGNKKHPLHANAVVLGNKLVQLVAAKRDDSDYQVAFAKCFINKPGSINFDELSKSKVLSSMLKNFGNDSIRAWIVMLKGLMTSQEEVPESDYFRIRCLQQMCQLIKSYNAYDTFLWAVSKFLFVYAYFDVSNCKKDIAIDETEKLERFTSPVGEKLQKQFPDGFKSTFAHLCQVASSGVNSQKEKLQEQTRALTLMGDFIVGLFGKKRVKLLSSAEKPLDDDIRQTIEDLRSKIEQIDSLKKQSTEANIFKLLHLGFVIELFESYNEICAILPDLAECANRSLFVDKKTRAKTPDEPLWADVLTDLLLSLLASKSKYTKNVIVSAFKHLAPFISAVGLQTLTEALLNRDAFQTDDSDAEDDEEMDEEDADAKGKDDAEEDEQDDDDEGEESEESDEDLEDDNDEARVDEQFKLDVIKALGSAVENDGDSDDAVSDSEMFKIDESLAQVFRKKFGDKKRANEQQNMMQTLKFRILELIQIVVEQKQDLSLELTLDLVSSVLLVAKSHYAIKNVAYITNKCINIFEKLTSKKRFEQEESLNEQVVQHVLDQLMEMQR